MSSKGALTDLRNPSRRYDLGNHVYIVGRDDTCDLVFPHDGELSRKHCLIFPIGEQFYLMDFKSSNGVYLNDQKVNQSFLHPGDKISIGEQAFRFEQEGSAVPGDEGSEGAKKFHTMMDFKEKLEKTNELLANPDTGLEEDPKEADAFNKLCILYKVAKLIASELELDELLNKIIDLAIRVVRADRGFVLLLDERGQLQKVMSRKMEGMMTGNGPIHISGSIVRETCQKREPLLTQDAMMDKRFETSGSVMMFNIRSAMCCPMFNKRGGLNGVIYLDNRLQARSFTEDDLELLSAFADQAAIAIENAKLFNQVRKETEMRNNLSRYLSPQVVEKVLKEGAAPGIGGKSVRVAILFADIRGFTTFSEKQGPDKAIQFLNAYLPAMTRIIFANQGTLDKFLGDGIMAVFGAPFEIQQNSLKAIQAAVRMQSEMKNINRARLQAGEQPLHMGIGINTGPVISGNVGLHSEDSAQSRLEFTVIGDTVNTAARLQGAAGPGEILVTEGTYLEAREAIQGKLRVVPRGEMTFKGKEIPINIMKVEPLVVGR